MTNIETDKLGLVQLVPYKDVPGLFRRTVSSGDGFSIEIFRGEKHLASIASKEEARVSNPLKSYERLGVRRDDVIYRVNLGGKLFPLEGTFTTADTPPLHPGYKVVLELAVIDPTQFIKRYRQQDDPVRIALAALEGELRRYASFRANDRLKSDELGYRVEHTLNVGNNKTIGLDVVRVHDVVIFMDPHAQKIKEVIQEKEIERTGVQEDLKTESIKNDFGRNEREKDLQAQMQAQRQEDEERRLRERRDEEEKRLQARLDKLAGIVISEESIQIRDKLAAGYTLKEIVQEHPELGMAFPALPSSNSGRYIEEKERPQLIGKESQHAPENINNTPLDGQVDRDRVSPQGTSRQKIEALTLDLLGFTLQPAKLSQGQRTAASLSESTAFLVTMVEDSGPAEEAGLSIGDIVVGVNDEIVSDAEMMADALKLRDQEGKISLQVLRGKQLISLFLQAGD